MQKDKKFYHAEKIRKMNEHLDLISLAIRILCNYFIEIKVNQIGQIYLCEGLMRRLELIDFCIHEIFIKYPPESNIYQYPKNKRITELLLQSFYAHLYGSCENMARIIAERKRPENNDNYKVSFLTKEAKGRWRKILPDSLLDYFSENNIERWYDYFLNYRHGLAHRIPLYIPESVDEDNKHHYETLKNRFIELHLQNIKNQNNLLTEEICQLRGEISSLTIYQPICARSTSEGESPIPFHDQIINDWLTLLDICCLFVDDMLSRDIGVELRSKLKSIGIDEIFLDYNEMLRTLFRYS